MILSHLVAGFFLVLVCGIENVSQNTRWCKKGNGVPSCDFVKIEEF